MTRRRDGLQCERIKISPSISTPVVSYARGRKTVPGTVCRAWIADTAGLYGHIGVGLPGLEYVNPTLPPPPNFTVLLRHSPLAAGGTQS